MNRYKCTIAYDGARFEGYQIQKEKRTVQLEIQKALSRIHKGAEIKVYASGRTDAGVHAEGQVLHFDSVLTIAEQAWQKALNANLPNDIWVKRVEKVDGSFHARFEVVKKEYRYKLDLAENFDVFRRDHVYHYPYPLNIEAIQEACPFFIGEHDFTSFCSAKTEVEDKTRHIYSLEAVLEGNELEFRIVGNGFLYNMVRIIVGTILEIGQGKKLPTDIPSILAATNRKEAGKTAPAHGLYLWEVHYNDN
ncbi:tRNA pseudouridine(38-40) synthase TruA [Sutcliffiella rhizosphaerae]|uniref:tRNA pseudouridine synthase A n=1 Tax=Sutcliffiella rhizosphaerae TaxID=2880967 RepID=A0ABN8AGB5_9BACI|nr:tRNA pseudouridine(38-40) synthase TruA [Sutcliffiella rhizosphaerae]CAG9622188.1 tRNA pseudouridine synthase A [Sutcliffiella rhizosphaerae]